MATTEAHRLPTDILPSRYQLELRPDLATATFAGRVVIDLEVSEPTDRIVCNAAELEVTSAQVAPVGGSAQPATAEVDAEAERLVLTVDGGLPTGPATLTIEFTGVLNDLLRGFYRSTFTDVDGHEHVIATTQFESTDARRAFPCWDEPSFKATFAVSLVVPDGLTALSSGAEEHVEDLGDGTRRIRFAETMRMATYVLAWVVGPFELTEAVDVDGVPVRLAAPPGRAGLTPFGLDAARHALAWLSGYFGIPYPSDKLDHVAIPDFAFGAMENLGCVTYRETALLVEADTAASTDLQRVAQVVAHETAHMWFGDLVTMRWWNGIWLNEAFATFMELKTTEAFRPEWDVWASFGSGRAAALLTDGLLNTRPVEVHVGPPEEAEAMFDVLTYQKGGSVLRMLEQYLGEDVFRRGISHYLQIHSHANTETSDLWDALEEVSGEPVRSTMESWIFQGGYPLVSVAQAGTSGVRLSQERFLYAPGADAPGGRWAVPVTLRASVGGEVVSRRLLLDEPVDVDLGGRPDWVVVNEHSAGFYRVRYQPELLAALSGDLQERTDALERAALVSDTWAAVVAGALPLSAWTALVEALGVEADPDVWAAVASSVALLWLTVRDEDLPVVSAWVRRVAGPTLERLGWDPTRGESERTAVARGTVIRLLGTAGADEAVRDEAASRLGRWPADRTALAPDVVPAAIAATASSGRPGVRDDLLRRYREADTPQDRVRFLMALAALPDTGELLEALDFAMSADVRSQDGPLVISGVLASRNGGADAWAWLEANNDAMAARFQRTLLLAAYTGIPGLVDPAVGERVHAFVDGGGIPNGGLRVAQLLERMDINAAFAAGPARSVAEAMAPAPKG